MDLSHYWPPAAGLVHRVAATGLTVGIAYVVGHVIRLVLGLRLRRRAHADTADWGEVLLVEIRRRIPFWSLLVGVHLSLPRWLAVPSPGYDDANDVVSALALASATFAAAAVATRLVSAYGARATGEARVSALTQNVIRIVITVLGGLMIAGIFRYDIRPYLTALGVGGLAVALALQDPLSNLFAGIFMSASGQVRLGEYVKLDTGLEGYVLDFNWRATSIRLLSGNVAIVPNAKLAQSTVTNFHQPTRDVNVGIEVSVDYANDLARVEGATLDVARAVVAEVPGALKTAAPTVRFQSLGPPLVTLAVGMRSEDFADQFLIKHELIKRLHARYMKDGITFRAPAEIVTRPMA